MLFHEVYGSYYQTVSLILKEAVKGTLTKKSMDALIRKYAFGESFLRIPDGLMGEQWRLMHKDLTTPLTEEPDVMLTELQKSWLKALLDDPRIQLFDPEPDGLDDVKPLFTQDMFVYYDRYTDGDDFLDASYIRNFRTILAALREEKDLHICYESEQGRNQHFRLTPHYLEYSEKDNRFRLYAAGEKRSWTLNLARISDCDLLDTETQMPLRAMKEKSLNFELVDDRNALERVLLHFSHLRKETKRLDEKHYRVTLFYDSQDETEMVIRLLSFGPIIKVTGPPEMIQHLSKRIRKQNELANFFTGAH